MEERLVAQAGAATAPRLSRAGAARALGAKLARLEDTLAGRALEIQDNHPGRTGLTPDQAAAVLSVLTDGKRVSVINAPAGSGKTRVMTEAARLWAAAGRPIVGITPSQSARNTLAAGIPESYNTAQFLGHLPGQRGARGPHAITEDTLLLVDESSTIPTPDLAAVVSPAEERSAKMVMAGDTGQLQAVENGGAMSLLAAELGYVQLPDPVRFRAAWEQAASLRLRTGDASVLAEYDQHGGSAQVRFPTAFKELIDAQPHRPIHRVPAKRFPRHPPHLATLTTAGCRTTGSSSGQENGELLPHLAIARVKDHVLRIGVNSN
jgi:hypothetical protein